MLLNFEDESWNYNTIEEFFSEFSNAKGYTFEHTSDVGYMFYILGNTTKVRIKIALTKSDIESVFYIYEKNLENSIIRSESKPIKTQCANDVC